MLTANSIWAANKTTRHDLIYAEAGIDNNDDGLKKAQKIAAVINIFIEEYFTLAITKDLEAPDGSVLKNAKQSQAIQCVVDEFRTNALKTLRSAFPNKTTMQEHPKNIYEFGGAFKLASANSITRSLSTAMGTCWETIANVSPHAINPELEFGLKITGIDLIAKNIYTNEIEYLQLKTQKNTLTGSQGPRSASELLLHEHPVFCAAFSFSQWTFSCKDVPRAAGKEFWNRIGMDYELVKAEVFPLIQKFEEEFIKA